MAECTQLQYQPITGPVWREPVAEKLAWLPRVQQPARALEYRRVGDFQQPPFVALYRPDGLQWQPEDSYRGRAIARPPIDWGVYPLQVITVAYDPQTLGWTPQGRAPQIALERRIRGDFAQPPFPALYSPAGLQWQPEDSYRGRVLARALLDWTVELQLVTTPVYDPAKLEWMSSGRAPRVAVERRVRGDFQQPPFQALYKPERLEWQPRDRYTWRALPFSRQTVFSVAPPFVSLYRPEGMQWTLQGWTRPPPMYARRWHIPVFFGYDPLDFASPEGPSTPRRRTFDVPRIDREVDVARPNRVFSTKRRDRLQ